MKTPVGRAAIKLFRCPHCGAEKNEPCLDIGSKPLAAYPNGVHYGRRDPELGEPVRGVLVTELESSLEYQMLLAAGELE